MICGVLFLATLLCSCRAVKVATNVTERDSSYTDVRTIHDTIIERDTIYRDRVVEVEKESSTEIQFGAGGGTYNPTTGEMSNVSNVRTSEREKSLQRDVERLSKENTEIKHERDSLQKVVTMFSDQSKSEPEHMNGFERFMYGSGWVLWAIVVGVLLYYVVKLLRRLRIIPV